MFVCCASTGVKSEKTSDGFVKEFDEVTQKTTYTQKDFYFERSNDLYNLYNGLGLISVETENFNTYIRISDNSKSLAVNCDYAASDWLFVKEFVIYAGNLRLQKELKRYDTQVLKSGIREHCSCTLSDADIGLLKQICNNEEVKICFIGNKSRSEVWTVKAKMKNALLGTIEKYNSL